MEQGFDITAGLKIRKATMDDATALSTYCFPSDTLEETEKQLKTDIERMERGDMFRLVAEVNGYAVGNIQLEFSKGKRKKVAEIHKLIVFHIIWSPPDRRKNIVPLRFPMFTDRQGKFFFPRVQNRYFHCTANSNSLPKTE